MNMIKEVKKMARPPKWKEENGPRIRNLRKVTMMHGCPDIPLYWLNKLIEAGADALMEELFPQPLTDEELIKGIVAMLESWQDTGTDYIVLHSFVGVANAIYSALLQQKIEEAKKQVANIIREYGLENVSVRDDMLELKAKGWKLLWQSLQGADK